MPGPVIAHADRQAVVGDARARRRSPIRRARTARRSRARAPAPWRSAADRARTGVSGSTSTSQRRDRAARARPARAPRRRSRVGCAQRRSVATAPASMRAISRMFSNRRLEPLGFAEDQRALLAQLLGVELRRLQVAGRDADRRQRRAQVVRERGQQRRLQIFAAPRDLGGLALVEQRRALDRDREHRRRARRACPARRRVRWRRAGRSAWCRRAAAPAGSRARRPSSSRCPE